MIASGCGGGEGADFDVTTQVWAAVVALQGGGRARFHIEVCVAGAPGDAEGQVFGARRNVDEVVRFAARCASEPANAIVQDEGSGKGHVGRGVLR